MIKNIIFDVGNVLVGYAPDQYMAEKAIRHGNRKS